MRDFTRAAQIAEFLRPVQVFMKRAEKGLASADEVTGIFAVLSNYGKLLGQSGAPAWKVAGDAADEEALGSEFPVQIGKAAMSMKEAIVDRLRDYAARSPSRMQVLAQAALLNPQSLNLIQAARIDLPEIVRWISEAEREIRRWCVALSNGEIGVAVTEAWGDVGAGTPASAFDRWRDSIAPRQVPLPGGIAGYRMTHPG